MTAKNNNWMSVLWYTALEKNKNAVTSGCA